ncbi:hypothetical protein BH11PSE11_BH11PSE11_11560 [soil metagenome]
MNPGPQSSTGEHSDEISALIDTLHKSMQRLEELTGGEVDAVVDRDGRTFVLQRAQEQLRLSEAARESAILNALPAHIAMLDHQGDIVSVNDAWKQFADDNSLLGTRHAVGVNYLAVCSASRGEDAEEALSAAAGIRTVLEGSAKSFLLEYACHSPSQQRWFMMTATPLNQERGAGAVVMHLDITERRRAEFNLSALSKKTEQRERILSTTLASISDFAYIYDLEGRFLFVNQPLLDLWGLTLEQSVGKNFHDLGYPAVLADQLQREVQQVIDTKASVTGETPYVSPAGHDGFYEYIFSPVIGAQGVVEFVVGSTRDITFRKLAVEALRASEQEQRQLVAQLEIERSRLVAAQRVAKIGSWETDLTDMSVIWSEETHRIHETDPASFQPTHLAFLNLAHPQDRAMIEKAFRQSLCGNWRGFVEHRILFPDGRIKVVEERWSVGFDQDGRPARAIGTCQDITDRKEAEAARDRLAFILESTPDLVGMSDPAGQILYLNQAYRDALGVAKHERLEQLQITDFLSDPQNHPVIRIGIPTAISEGSWSGETTVLSRSGREIPISQVILAHKSTEGKLEYLSTIMRDITERKLAESAVQSSYAEFRNLTEAMPQIVWITKADGANLYFNQQWTDYTGMTPEESLGKGGAKPLHPDDKPSAKAAWQRAHDATGVYSTEARLRLSLVVDSWRAANGCGRQYPEMVRHLYRHSRHERSCAADFQRQRVSAGKRATLQRYARQRCTGLRDAGHRSTDHLLQ